MHAHNHISSDFMCALNPYKVIKRFYFLAIEAAALNAHKHDNGNPRNVLFRFTKEYRFQWRNRILYSTLFSIQIDSFKTLALCSHRQAHCNLKRLLFGQIIQHHTYYAVLLCSNVISEENTITFVEMNRWNFNATGCGQVTEVPGVCARVSVHRKIYFKFTQSKCCTYFTCDSNEL